MIRQFMTQHFRHFNAHTLVRAADAYNEILAKKGKMMVTMAGAMSTAEIGISLAEMIRQDKVHAITCTGANLEEDVFNLVAHEHYKKIADFRSLTAEDEMKLLEGGYNRVTDTCIPEHEAVRRIEGQMFTLMQKTEKAGQRLFPHEMFYSLIKSGVLKEFYQIDPKDSWMVAAAEKNLPIFVPGWEDSTMGNIYASHVQTGDFKSPHLMKSGIEYMLKLVDWYSEVSANHQIGFFQIGGGIAGDFPICVVPLLRQDLLKKEIPLWAYFCQISDSTTSYGSYSGATPNEKITWGKLSIDSPKFIIESDASIVAPLFFAYIMDM